MTTSYPGAVDNLTNPTPSDTLNSATVPHAAQHANLNDAMEAVQTVLGTNPQGTSSTVKDRIAAAEGAIINLGQDLDTRVPGETGSNAPTGTLPNGYVWVNTSDNSIKVWNGTTWVDPSNAGGGSTGPQWAVVSGGTVTEYTHPVYGVMRVHTFTANGTLTVTAAGQAQVLAVGCGGSAAGASPGAAGWVVPGVQDLAAGAVPITVGVLDAFGYGGDTTIGNIRANGGGLRYSDQANTPVSSSITGTAKNYGGNTTSSGQPANSGAGGLVGQAGSSGVVIVAVKKP